MSEVVAGTTTNSVFTGITGTHFYPTVATYDPSYYQEVNFGQRAFVYTPPTGYERISSKTVNKSKRVTSKEDFNIVLYTGDGSSNRAITGVGFQPDFVWIKNRSANVSHTLVDSVQGASSSWNTDASAIPSGSPIVSFDSDGFTLTGNATTSNSNGVLYVAYCWKAGGTAVANNNGTIASTVSVNSKSGFSIVKWTGTGANGTVGHGLSQAPDFIMVKNRRLYPK